MKITYTATIEVTEHHIPAETSHIAARFRPPYDLDQVNLSPRMIAFLVQVERHKRIELQWSSEGGLMYDPDGIGHAKIVVLSQALHRYLKVSDGAAVIYHKPYRHIGRTFVVELSDKGIKLMSYLRRIFGI